MSQRKLGTKYAEEVADVANLVSHAIGKSAADFDGMAKSYEAKGDATEARHWKRWAFTARILANAIYTEARK